MTTPAQELRNLEPLYFFKAKLVKVTDADTIVFQVDLGFRITTTLPFRLLGVNAPERYTEDGKIATSYVHNLLSSAMDIIVKTYKNPQDKYGRWLAIVIVDGQDLSELLIANDLAVRF